MGQKSVFERVMRDAGIPKDIAQAIEMAVLECDLIGWRGDELGTRLLMWRDRKVKATAEAIRRQMSRSWIVPTKNVKPGGQNSAAPVRVPPPTTKNPVGLPDVQFPASVLYPNDVPGQLRIEDLPGEVK